MRKLKKKISAFVLFAITQAQIFAAGGSDLMPAGMQSLADGILEIFTGAFVKTILIIMLAGCAVAYGFNKDNEKMKRNIIAIAVAVGILVAASSIVDAIWNASK
jgi:type IV secretory pathway VirB2 component (pilin)